MSNEHFPCGDAQQGWRQCKFANKSKTQCYKIKMYAYKAINKNGTMDIKKKKRGQSLRYTLKTMRVEVDLCIKNDM
jgi:hypothetical protein